MLGTMLGIGVQINMLLDFSFRVWGGNYRNTGNGIVSKFIYMVLSGFFVLFCFNIHKILPHLVTVNCQ